MNALNAVNKLIPGRLVLQDEPTVFEVLPEEFSEAIASDAKNPAPPATATTTGETEVALDFDAEATNYLGSGQPSAARALFETAAPIQQSYDDEATHIFFSAEGGLSLPDVPDDGLTTVSAPTPLRVSPPAVSPHMHAANPAANRGGGPVPPPSGRQPTGAHAPAPTAIARASAVPAVPTPKIDPRLATISGSLSLPPSNRAPLYWVLGVALLVILTGLVVKTSLGITLGLRKPPTGIIEIRTTPDVSASVRLDGIYRGHAPLRLEGVPSGARIISVEANNYEPATRSINLEGGSTIAETINLTPTTPTPIASP
jgi:hypothetical protein